MTYLRLLAHKFAVPPCVNRCVTYRTVEYTGLGPATNVISIEFLSFFIANIHVVTMEYYILYVLLLFFSVFCFMTVSLDAPTLLAFLLSLATILPTSDWNLLLASRCFVVTNNSN